MDVAKMREVLERMKANRPKFPKRAIVTAGMPYGNKELHYGHVCGMFVYADFFARFLKDKLGKDNVIFVQEQIAMVRHQLKHIEKRLLVVILELLKIWLLNLTKSTLIL